MASKKRGTDEDQAESLYSKRSKGTKLHVDKQVHGSTAWAIILNLHPSNQLICWIYTWYYRTIVAIGAFRGY